MKSSIFKLPPPPPPPSRGFAKNGAHGTRVARAACGENARGKRGEKERKKESWRWRIGAGKGWKGKERERKEGVGGKGGGESDRRGFKISDKDERHGQRGDGTNGRARKRGMKADRWRHRGGEEGMISGKNRHGVFAFNLGRELTERLNHDVAKKRGNARNRENVAAGKFNNNSLSLSRNFQLCAD